MHDTLDLEVMEIETQGKPGCGGGGSSSTSPKCTCPVVVETPDAE